MRGVLDITLFDKVCQGCSNIIIDTISNYDIVISVIHSKLLYYHAVANLFLKVI
jgi:hypothetical protein